MGTAGSTRRRRVLAAAVAACVAGWVAPAATARQETVAVMVDESPTASQLAERMLDQRAANVGESARIARRLLAEFGDRLVPDPESGEGAFRSARAAVEAALAAHPDLLARYRELAEAEAASRLEQGDLDGLFREAIFTAAGLEAALRLAQIDVERGLGGPALRRLERIAAHPDRVGEAAVRAEAIRALAEWIEGRSPRPDPPPPARVAADAFAGGAIGEAPDEAWQVIWSQELPDSAFRRAFRELQQTGRLVPRTATRIAEEGSLLVAMPAADEETVYLNEGHVVRAIDRLSRRERWRTPLEPGDVANLGAVGDPTLVSVSEGIAVTVSGHAIGTNRTGSGRVVAIDARTGEPRWFARLGEAARGDFGDGQELFPYGPATIAGDAVFVLARRVTNRLESVDFLVCLSLEDGSRRWITRLGSSGGIRLGGMRPFSRPFVEGGRVFVASSVGVVAAIEVADGEIAWLRRMPVPLRDTRLSVEPWEIQAPVALGGSIFVVAPDQASILRLDPRTGREIGRRAFDDGAIGQPRYLLAGRDREGRDVLIAAGSDLAALDPQDLEAVRWRFGLVNDALLSNRPGLVNRIGIRGRAQIAGDRLLVPGRSDVLVADLASGAVVSRLAIDEPANLLHHDGQLLLAGKDRLQAAMPPDRARARLAEKRLADPGNPEWPLASVELEFAAGDVEAALAAASEALAAVEASQQADERERLFEQLLSIDAAIASADPRATRTRELLSATALAPSQRIREALTRGDWHAANGRIGEAMEAWQGILSEASLAREPLRLDETEVLAAAAARTRMQRLAESEGNGVLAPADALARIRLERARRDGASAASLLAIAREFPLSAAASQARLDAAAKLEAEGRPRDALLALLEGWRDGAADRTLLRDAAFAASLRRGWLDAARSILDLDAAAPRGAESAPWPIDDPWGRLAGSGDSPRLGAVPSDATTLPGRLVPVEPRAATRTDGVLLAADGVIAWMQPQGDALVERWAAPIEDPLPTVLRFGDSILLWQLADRDRPVPMRIGASNGRVAWVNPSVAELFRPIDPESPHPFEGQRPIPGGTDPWRAGEVLPLVVEDLLVLVRRDGAVVALDLEDGRTVRWSRTDVLDAVFQAQAGPLGVVLAGRGRNERGESVPTTVWIDPEGEVRRRWSGTGDVRWLRLSPLGEIAWGTGEGVEVRSIAAGDGGADGRWRSSGPWARNTWEAWLSGDRLLVREGDDRLAARRLADGAAWGEGGAFEAPRREGPLAVFGGLWRDGGGDTVLFGDRAVRFGRKGELAGIDAVAEDRNYLLAAPADDEIVVLSFRGAGPATDAEGTPRTEFVYSAHRFGLSDGLRSRGPALEIRTLGPRFDSIRAIDGWLLLSSPTSSVAVPLR